MSHAKLPTPHGIVLPAEAHTAWASFVTVFGLIQALMLLAAGIGLLLTQPWARVLSVVYAFIAMFYALVSSVINLPTLRATLSSMPGMPPGAVPLVALAATVLGLILGLIYPVLLLFYMTRTKVVEAFAPELPLIPPPPPAA